MPGCYIIFNPRVRLESPWNKACNIRWPGLVPCRKPVTAGVILQRTLKTQHVLGSWWVAERGPALLINRTENE